MLSFNTTFSTKFVVCLGESRLSQVNNSPRANVFPAGVANFGKAMYRSLERSTQDTRDGFFCTVPRPHFLGRALIWPGYFGEHILGLFGLHPSSLSKSAGFVFLSGKASLVSISATILLLRSWHVYFLLEFVGLFGIKMPVGWQNFIENPNCPDCVNWSKEQCSFAARDCCLTDRADLTAGPALNSEKRLGDTHTCKNKTLVFNCKDHFHFHRVCFICLKDFF